MDDERQSTGEQFLLRVGGVAAIVGTVLQVAAGTSQSGLLSGSAEVALPALAAQADWVWPLIYLAFIVGALFWVAALVALASSLTDGVAWALGRLALAAVVVGVAMHAIDGALNAVALNGLARAWAAAAEGERAALVQHADLMLRILDATWSGVITLFHGIPFVLAGLAVVLSRRYPVWLGWIGFIGGAGSLVVGVAMLFNRAPAGLAVPFAVVLSLFMVILGWLMWSQTETSSENYTRDRR